MEQTSLLEKARKAYLRKIIVVIVLSIVFISIIICCGITIYASQNAKSIREFSSLLPYLIFGFVVGIGIYNSLVVQKAKRNYRSQYKAYFVRPAMEKTFSNLHYDHEASMSRALIDEAGALDTRDRFTSNDYATGEYKEVYFAQADIKIEEEYEDDDGESYRTVFKGRYMIFEFPKQFNFRLKIVQKHFGGPQKITFGKSERKFNRISTESNTFDEKFRVYAQDGFEAYYILSPDLMERIESLSGRMTGKLLLYFVDKKLHIAIKDNADSLEPPKPFQPINEAQELSRVTQEIRVITDFIEYLKLDSKLFKS